MPWFDATWERVGGKLNAHQPYLEDFLAPNEDTLPLSCIFNCTESRLSKKAEDRANPPR